MKIFAIWSDSRFVRLHSVRVLAAITPNAFGYTLHGAACLRKFGEVPSQLVEVINAANLLPILIPTEVEIFARKIRARKINENFASSKLLPLKF
jgi:hypothetical protein